MKTFSFDYKRSEASLLDDGPLIPVVLTAPLTLVAYLEDSDLPPFPTLSGYALIDTGADRSAVDAGAMSTLQIPSVGTEPFLTTHGIAELGLYNLSAFLPDLQTGLIPLKRAPGGQVSHRSILEEQIVMLLGRDLLQQFVLTYDGPNATIHLQR